MRVVLVPNTRDPEAVLATTELAAWCAARGLEPAMSHADAMACDLPGFGVEPTELGEPVLAVALGGDGTILKAVHLLGDVDVPLLGVKFGRLGFLSGAGSERMKDAVEAALAGDISIERRATLSIQVVMGGRGVGAYRALNEVALTRGASGRVIAFDVSIGGHDIARMRADGIIVATATGSTAYALSAGGPIVAPGFGGMVVVPIAPHTLTARPIVTEPVDCVEISFPDPTRADCQIHVDGAATPIRRDLDRLVVSRGQHDVSLVKLDGRNFYETVAAEFFEGR